jgi:hypothetical protein
LVLQIACLLQTDAAAPQAPARWVFSPGVERYGYPEARERLSAAAKPLLVGVLAGMPGWLCAWEATTLPEAERRRCERELANQRAFVESKLDAFGVPEDGAVRFEGWGTVTDLTVAELRRWAQEYLVMCPWTMGRATDDTHRARFLVRLADHSTSPGGVCHPGPPAA